MKAHLAQRLSSPRKNQTALVSTEAGTIPSDWEIRPFLSVARIASGQVDPKEEPYRSMILVAPDHIESQSGLLIEKKTAESQGAISGKYEVRRGDIVYSKIRPHLRKAVLADFDGLCSADMYPLRPASDVHPGFLLATILGERFSRYAESVSVRSGMPKINRLELADYRVGLPRYEEQEAIAKALSDADSLIASLDTLIAKKRSIKKGAVQGLLSADTRLPKFDGNWEQKSFSELFEFHSTGTNSRADLGDNGDAYYVHYGDIHTRFHDHLDFRKTAPPRIARVRCRNAALLKNGDWLMADASEDLDGVGKSVEVLGLADGELAVSGLHTFLLRERRPTFAPGFKGHLGNSEQLRAQYQRVMTGMKVYGVSKGALRDLTLPVPGWDEQSAIAEVLDDMAAEIDVLSGELAKAQQIKQGMMQDLLTGRVRLV